MGTVNCTIHTWLKLGHLVFASNLILGTACPQATRAQAPLRSIEIPTSELQAIGNEPLHKPAAEPPVAMGTSSTTSRQAILRKMNEIRFKQFGPFDSIPLSDAVKMLYEECQKLDPEHKGINFILNPYLNQPDRVQGGQPQQARVDMGNVLISMAGLDDVTLAQALDATCKLADQPIQFIVEDYAIVFTVKPDPGVFTRTYKVDPSVFLQGLQGVIQRGGVPGVNLTPNQVTGANAGQIFQQMLSSQGVNVGGNRPGTGRVQFDPAKGQLLASATAADLKLIEQSLESLNKPEGQTLPAHILIKVVSVRAAHSVSDKAALGRDVARFTQGGPKTTTWDYHAALKAWKQSAGIEMEELPEVKTTNGRQAHFTAPGGTELDILPRLKPDESCIEVVAMASAGQPAGRILGMVNSTNILHGGTFVLTETNKAANAMGEVLHYITVDVLHR